MSFRKLPLTLRISIIVLISLLVGLGSQQLNVPTVQQQFAPIALASTDKRELPKPSGKASSGGRTRLLEVNDVVSLRKLQSVQMSPDARHVAFVVEEPNSEAQSRQTSNTDIWLINSDGS